MSSYRTIGEVEETYLRNHPEEVDDYISALFNDYAESGDTASLMASLRVVSRVKGVSLGPVYKHRKRHKGGK
jgi:DNA-binding phage protein